MQKGVLIESETELQAQFRQCIDGFNEGKSGRARVSLRGLGACTVSFQGEKKWELAQCLSRFFIDHGFSAHAMDIIEEEMPYLNREEAIHLSQAVNQRMLNDVLCYRVKKNLEEIATRIYSCLSEMGQLNIEGFMLFRMRDYEENIRRSLESAVEQILGRYETDQHLDGLREMVKGRSQSGCNVYVDFYAGG